MYKFLIILVFISSFSLQLFSGCQTAGNLQRSKTSGIYGKIEVYPPGLGKELTLKLSGSNSILQLDENGNYYFGDIEPGSYDLEITVPGLVKHFLKKVDAVADSITIVTPSQIRSNDSYPDIAYAFVRIKKIFPLRFGSLSGYVYMDNKVPAPNAIVYLKNTFWKTKADSSGFFKIERVLQGKYELYSTYFRKPENTFLSATVYPVIIHPDSLTQVNNVQLELPFIE
ncbi:MAG TPA: hypothetical protein VHO03_04585 [Ignavibacteriales bacterium]|nr:hypothetical protein [Ignavibacteriales bacterium]